MKTQALFDHPWAGHDRLARQLSCGMTRSGRELVATLLSTLLLLPVLMVLLAPDPQQYGMLIVVLALPTSLRVGRATVLSLDAMRTLWLAPDAARVRWMQGWRHLALVQGPAWAGAGLLVVVLREGLSETALFVFGAVLATQALSAWGAYSLRDRAPHEWKLLAVFGSLALGGLCVTSRPLGTGTLLPMAWAATGLVIGSAGLLWRLWWRLRQLQPGRCPRPAVAQAAPWSMGQWLKGWAVLDVGGAQRGAAQVLMAALNPILMVGINPIWYQQSQWLQPYGPAKLLELGFLTLLVASSLVHKPYHWRQWLMPGGVPRQRLGAHLLFANLKLQCLSLMLVAIVAATGAWGLGVPLQVLDDFAQRTWPLLLEWAVATALAVVWAGLYTTRRSGAWLFWLAIVLPAAWAGLLWMREGSLPTWGELDGGYIALLLVALATLLLLANAAWARTDLHRLTQSHRPRAVRWWEG